MIRKFLLIKILMIFSLFCCVFSVDRAYAQDDKHREAETYEQQVLSNLEYGSQYDLSSESNSLTMGEKYRRIDRFSGRNKQVSSRSNQNDIQLQMNGNQNQVRAEQIQGKNNYMDLGVDGTSNQGRYLQEGSNNFIYDRISGEGVTREIQQFGNELGIYNQGLPTLPMKIQQRGKAMRLLIK